MRMEKGSNLVHISSVPSHIPKSHKVMEQDVEKKKGWEGGKSIMAPENKHLIIELHSFLGRIIQNY